MQRKRPHTRRKIRALFIATILLTMAVLQGCHNQPETPDDPFALSNYQGKWLVLNYWAEWCTPCLKEIPELNKLHQRYSSELAVAAVNFDKVEGEELTELAKRMNFLVDIIQQDPADQLRLSRPAGLPTTYIFDRQGALTAKLVGPQTIESILEHTDITGEN